MGRTRIAVALAVVAVAGVVAGARLLPAAGQEGSGEEAPGALGTAAPAWAFVVHGVQDPYRGRLERPEEPEPGVRYVGAEVGIVNGGAEPLTYGTGSVRARDDQGVDYAAGAAAGSEPPLRGRTLQRGERARGWVWFAVPAGARLREIVLVPTAPELRVALGEPGGSTPTPAPSPASRASPAASPIARPDGEAAVVALARVDLRAGPGRDAPVLAALARGTALTVTGPVERADGVAWVPVAVAGTGQRGYVAAYALAPPG